MNRTTLARNAGNSGRVTIFGPELGRSETNVGDEVEFNIADRKGVAHVPTGSKETDQFPIVTPA